MNCGHLMEKYIKAPQDYSFFIFGTHGTGLQSLLFFISRLQKDNKNVAPLPLHWTNRDILPNLTCLLWKKKLLGLLPSYAWGITFEGSPKNLGWIFKNIKRGAPAIVLVRDPIDTLVSHINYYIGRDIFVNNTFMDIDFYCNNIINSEYQLDRTCGFEKNLAPLKEKISDYLYIDTQDIVGKQTSITIRQISNFLKFDYPKNFNFDIKVNSQFERAFPFSIDINGCRYYLSCFPNKYKNELFPKYNDVQVYYFDDCYHSNYFPNQRFYIFSENKTGIGNSKNNGLIIEWAEKTLFQHYEKMQKYSQYKIEIADLLDFFKRKEETYEKIKRYLETQTKIIADLQPKIFSNWKNFNIFNSISRS